MRHSLKKELHRYFSSRRDLTGKGKRLLNRLAEELPYFQISAIHRDDLQSQGFDVSNVSDNDMERLADKMSDDYCNQLFWDSMETIAKEMVKIPHDINL